MERPGSMELENRTPMERGHLKWNAEGTLKACGFGKWSADELAIGADMGPVYGIRVYGYTGIRVYGNLPIFAKKKSSQNCPS